MERASVPLPVFPGGVQFAPEAMPGGCANPACMCLVAPGRTHCCRACARAPEDADTCFCGHAGCSHRGF